MKLGNKHNHEFYIHAIKKHGISPLGVHWQSQYSQYKRFEILTYLIQKDIKESSLVDAGCGFGEYFNYLEKNSMKPKKYIGIDLEDEMIKRAKLRFSDVIFEKKDILKDELIPADYYVCSGAMNILTKNEMFEFIDKCFLASKKGFAFNFLKKDSFNDIRVSEVLGHCKHLSRDIYIKDNYLENDISVYLKKQDLTN